MSERREDCPTPGFSLRSGLHAVAYLSSTFQPTLGAIHLFSLGPTCVALFFASSLPLDSESLRSHDALLVLEAQTATAAAITVIDVQTADSTHPSSAAPVNVSTVETRLAALHDFECPLQVLPVMYHSCCSEVAHFHVSAVEPTSNGRSCTAKCAIVSFAKPSAITKKNRGTHLVRRDELTQGVRAATPDDREASRSPSEQHTLKQPSWSHLL